MTNPPSNPPEKPPTLPYASPQPRPRAQLPWIVASCITTTTILLVLFYMGAIVVIGSMNEWAVAPLVLGIASVAALIGYGVNKREGVRAVGFGMLIGTGLALLLNGACWVTVMK